MAQDGGTDTLTAVSCPFPPDAGYLRYRAGPLPPERPSPAATALRTWESCEERRREPLPGKAAILVLASLSQDGSHSSSQPGREWPDPTYTLGSGLGSCITMLLPYPIFSSFLESIYRRGARRWRKLYRANGHLFQAKRFNRVSVSLR